VSLRRAPSAPDQGRVLAGALTLVSAGTLAVALLVAVGRGRMVDWLQWAPTAAAFTLVGWAIARRQRRNAVGWLMLAFGAQFALLIAALAYSEAVDTAIADGHVLSRRAVGLADGAAWWMVLNIDLLVLPLSLLLLLFPDGRLPSRRWRPVLWSICAVSGLTVALVALSDVNFPNNYAHLTDPVTPLPGQSLRSLYSALQVLELLGLGTAVASLVVRFRRSGSPQREQIKWVTASATVMAGLMVALQLTPLTYLVADPTVSGAVGMPLFAVSIGTAVLRYHLYDIDRIISRTTSYAVVTGLVLATYLGVVAVVTRVLPDSGSLAVAGATLAAAGITRPVLRRVQDAVDQRFDRARYDARVTVDEFAQGLRTRVAPELVVDQLLDVVHHTIHPAQVSVWTAGAPR
jgi:hypothetical protein